MIPDYFSALPEICPEIMATYFAIGIDMRELTEYENLELGAQIISDSWEWMQSCHQRPPAN